MLWLSLPNDAATWDEGAYAFGDRSSLASSGVDLAEVTFIDVFLELLRTREAVQMRLVASQLSFSQRQLVANCDALSKALIEASEKFRNRNLSDLPRVIERALDPADLGSADAHASVCTSLALMRAIIARLQDGTLSYNQVCLVREHERLCGMLQLHWQIGVVPVEAGPADEEVSLAEEQSVVPASAPEQPEADVSQNLWELLSVLVGRLADTTLESRRRALRSQIDDVLKTLQLGASRVLQPEGNEPELSEALPLDDVAYLEDIFEEEDDLELYSSEKKWVASTTEHDDEFILEDIQEPLIEDVFFDMDVAEPPAVSAEDLLEILDVELEPLMELARA